MASSGADGKQMTWLIVGASRGIGREFVRQISCRGDRVYATIRGDPVAFGSETKSEGPCQVLCCDVTSETSIESFVNDLANEPGIELDYVVINAGVLKYPNVRNIIRPTKPQITNIKPSSFNDFALHLHTNTIGPIICAQKLLKTHIPIHTIVFISSDSGSAQNFLEMEDGFAAYAASKAALNQALRHMAAELKRKGSKTTILALHPGEVATDMANVELSWEVVGQMTPKESVEACITVIERKCVGDSGTFWTWEDKVVYSGATCDVVC